MSKRGTPRTGRIPPLKWWPFPWCLRRRRRRTMGVRPPVPIAGTVSPRTPSRRIVLRLRRRGQ